MKMILSMTTLVVTLFVSSQLLQGVQAGGCYDDEDYRYYGDHWKDCEWIADNDRCDRVKDGHHVGKEYCPYSCGYCFVDHCYDDHDFRYMKIDYKDCDWVKKNGRCNSWQEDKHVGKEYCPKSCDECGSHPAPYPKPTPDPTPAPYKKPTPNPTPAPYKKPTPHPVHDGCNDDPDYRYYGDDWKDCEWIADNDRCDRWGHGKHVGEEYCPKSCGYCDGPKPVPEPTHPPQEHCYDDEDYRYHGYDWKDCHWIAEKDHCDQYDDGEKVGKEYCPKSCGYCDNNPGADPTKAPVHTPTEKPVDDCHSEVHVEQHCYDDYDGSIEVSFYNCDPLGKDWIGIYRAGDSYSNWPEGWLRTCGTRTCTTPYHSGTVYFDHWKEKLEPGKYVAYLFHDDEHVVKATSEYFYVKDGHGC